MTRPQLESLIEAVEHRSTNLVSSCHGPQHWRCVSLLGIYLARSTPGADALVAFLFGLFHDAMRENNSYDPKHGERGAALLSELSREDLVSISDAQYDAICIACETHTTAAPTNRADIGVCYDADRLTLWRVDVQPTKEYLSTEAGIAMAASCATRHLHDHLIDWAFVLDELFAEASSDEHRCNEQPLRASTSLWKKLRSYGPR